MKRLAVLLLLLSIQFNLFAQTTGSIKGKVIDSVGKQSLRDASIEILKASDSSMVLLGLAKQDGSFEVGNIPLGSYILRISFQSYASMFKKIRITTTVNQINLGTVYLNSVSDRLPDVVVTQSPIQVKNDTISYNASSFNTKPNALAEDLIKKLPGLDVATDGTIKAQGETVTRVLVNGKRFFGDDPKMATRNLPPDVIEKIQVFDDLSDQSKFTGFDDGNRVKTMNITTKKNANKGYFGKLVAGIGTNNDFDESINIHRFDGNSQLSVLGQGNDINKQNFTQADMLGGGPRGGGGGGGATSVTSPGVTTTWAGGANFKDSWGTLNSSAYGSYFFNSLDTKLDQMSQNQTILSADSSIFKNSISTSLSRSPSHRINFNLEENFDTLNSLVFRPNITFQSAMPTNTSSSSTTVDSLNGPILNSTNGHSSSQNSGYNINGSNLQLRHKFKKRFRTISLDVNLSASNNTGNGYNYSANSFTSPHYSLDTLNQFNDNSFNSFGISPTLSYTEPIAKNQILEFRFNYNYSKNNSVSNTYQYNNFTGLYDNFDSLYSNSYKYESNSETGTISYRLQKQKYNFNLGSGVQFTSYSSDNIVKNVVVANKVVNFTPTANFIYNFSKTNNLRIYYTGRTGQPSVANLQPIKTISGLDTAIGNPNLSPQFTNSIRLLYAKFDAVTQRVLFATINASMISNDIQSSIIQHSNGTKTTTYTNLNGTYNVSGYFNYGFSLKKPKSNLNFTTNLSYAQSQTLQSYDSTVLHPNSDFVHNTNLGETIKWTTNLKDHFDMNVSTGINYTIANNSLNPKLNSNYFTYNAVFDVTFYTKNGWIIASDFNYTYSGNRPAGYNASVPLISPAIAKQFLKNKRGELRLSMFDLLNQNASVSRSVSQTSITDSRTSVLTQYFMLTFTFNLRNFAGQQQQRMPGMFQGMFRGGGFPGGGFDGGGGGGFRRNP
jgi:hypothetical protein